MDCICWRVSESTGNVRENCLEKVKSGLNGDIRTDLSRVRVGRNVYSVL